MTALYQLTSGTSILRTSDGSSIPDDPANGDYQTYLAWVALGNTPDPPAVMMHPQRERIVGHHAQVLQSLVRRKGRNVCALREP